MRIWSRVFSPQMLFFAPRTECSESVRFTSSGRRRRARHGFGCILRSAAAEVAVYEQAYLSDDDDSLSLDMAPGYLVVAGTMLVGAAQPFFQCTPSLLAANWFGESETTLAATLA